VNPLEESTPDLNEEQVWPQFLRTRRLGHVSREIFRATHEGQSQDALRYTDW